MRSLLYAVLAVLIGSTSPVIADEPPDSERAREFLISTIGPDTYDLLPEPSRAPVLRYAVALLERSPGPRPISRCFAAGTPRTVLESYQSLEEAARTFHLANGGPQPAFQLNERWSTTATNGSGQGTQGLPITLTWSIVPDVTPIPANSLADSSDPSNLRVFLAGVYGGSPTGDPHLQPYFSHFEAVFANISAQTGITYVYEPNDDGITLDDDNPGQLGVRGDIRIGGHDIDGNRRTLGYNSYPNEGDMVLDTNDDWFANNREDPDAFRNLLEHEHGHGLGLEHVCPLNHTKLMEPLIGTVFRGVQFDDIYSLQRLYGDFHEKHSPARNNDSPANATLLPTPGQTVHEWLSIDDDSDVDFYAIDAAAGSVITVRIIPSTHIYPEGPQNFSCTADDNIDSSTRQDLALDLLAPDGSTILASGPGTPAGQPEEIIHFITPANGIHFIRVDDVTAADTAQLYRMELEVLGPSIVLDLAAPVLIEESFRDKNGAPDPGETVRYEFSLRSIGSFPASNVQATLTGPPSFTSFSGTQSYGSLHTGETSTQSFVFGLEGNCGETVPLTFRVTADGGFTQDIDLNLTLGTTVTLLEEAADSSPTLPPGWLSDTTGGGSTWTPTSSDSCSAPRAFHTPNKADTGTATLRSPSIALPTGPAILSFKHLYDTESIYDGGVLEISIDGGPWTDILTAGASFTKNGYNGPLGESENPLTGRPAWSGNSGLFVQSIVTLPPSSQNSSIQLQWVLSSDDSRSEDGWYIDDIVLTAPSCDATGPILALTSEDTTASEFSPQDTASITISTPLPSIVPIPATLDNTGTADLALDVSLAAPLELPAGQTSLAIPISALPDGLPEGTETLDLSLSPGTGSALLTILDAPYDHWAFTNFGPAALSGPYQDFEGDGLTNLEEYTHQTNPTAANPAPELNPVAQDGFFRIEAPFSTLPPDVLLGAESSADLVNWSKTGIIRLPDGFQIPLVDPTRYLRLTYELLPAAP